MTQTFPQPAAPNAPARRRWRRIARWLAIVSVPILVVGGIAYYRMANSARIRAVAKALIEERLETRVEIGAASFSWFGGIRLSDIAIQRLGEPIAAPEPEAVPLLTCRETRVQIDPIAWLRGERAIESVLVVEPTLTVDVEGGTIEQIEALIRKHAGRPRSASMAVPPFELRNARLRVLDAAAPAGDHQLAVSLRARMLPGDAPVYDVVWRDEGDEPAEGHVQFDLGTGRIRTLRGGSPWLPAEMLVSVAKGQSEAVRERILPIGLRGQARVTNAVWGRDPADAAASKVIFEFRGAEFSIPISDDDRAAAPDARFLRLRDVHGEATLTPEHVRAHAFGLLHEARGEIDAVVFLPPGPLRTMRSPGYEWKAEVKGLRLPRLSDSAESASSRFIRRWPVLSQLYDESDPRGTVDLTLDVARGAGPESRATVRGLEVVARGVEATYARLPYRLEALEGAVRYDRETLVVDQVHGKHHETPVTIDGRLAMGPPVTGRLAVYAPGLPLDDDLWSALSDEFRKVRADLQPQGAIDLAIDLTRGQPDHSVPIAWHWSATVGLTEVTLLPAPFPYPLTRVAGKVLLNREGARFQDVTARAGDAELTAGGDLVFERGGLSQGAVRIAARHLQADENLMAALPDDVREQVQAVHPSGTGDVELVSRWQPTTGTWTHEVEVSLTDVAIRPDAFPLSMEQLAGRVRIDATGVVFDGVTGRHENTTFSVDGAIPPRAAESPGSLLIRARNVRLTPQLREALPAAVREALSDWNAGGSIETVTTVTDLTSDGPRVETEIHLAGASIEHARYPVPLRDIHGGVTFGSAGVKVQALRARYGNATVKLDLESQRADNAMTVTASIAAGGLEIDDNLRAVLPRRLQDEWDRIKPEGTIDLYLDEVRRESGETAPVWSFSGRADLTDVSLAGAGIERMAGTISGGGTWDDGHGGGSLRGFLRVATVKLLERDLENVDGQWTFARSATGEAALALRAAQGRIYNGRAMAEGELTFRENRTDYRADATVHRMQIKPFLSAGSPDVERRDVTGLLNGQVYLSGTVGDGSSRQGGGRFEIVEGHIHELPILLAIVQVLNLSIPERNVFDNATVEFFIDGNRVQLEDIRIHSGRLSLIGTGSMTVPDHGVDLTFVQLNNPRWAVVPGVKELIHAATRDLLEIRVTGPLHRPNVRAAPFSGLRDEVKGLFQPKKRPAPPAGRP